MADKHNWDTQLQELDELLAQLPPTPAEHSAPGKTAPDAAEIEKDDFDEIEEEAEAPVPVTGMFGSGTKLAEYLAAQEKLFKHVPQPALVEFNLFRDQMGWITAEIQLDVPSSKAVDGITSIKAWESNPVEAIDSLIAQYDKALDEWAQHQEFLAKKRQEQKGSMRAALDEFHAAVKHKDIERLANVMRKYDTVWNSNTTENHLQACATEWKVTVPPKPESSS